MMGYRLFLDDLRFPATPGWVLARSYGDAVWLVENLGFPDYVSFDHDLGWLDDVDPFSERSFVPGANEKDGYDFAKWLCGHAMDRRIYLRDFFGFTVHSQNPIGAQNIRAYISGFMEAQDAGQV